MKKNTNTKLTNLTHSALVDLWVSTQGDLTVPPHKRDNPNRDLTKRCFVELLRRSPNSKTKGLHGVKR